jgi:hypothetical protein
MSRFDQLTLELISRNSIPDSEKLGLAELQLQRAQRMHALMIGGFEGDENNNNNNNAIVGNLEALRDNCLENLQNKRNSEKLVKQQEAEARQLADILKRQHAQETKQNGGRKQSMQSNGEKPTQDDVNSRTPTSATTPTAAAAAGTTSISAEEAKTTKTPIASDDI